MDNSKIKRAIEESFPIVEINQLAIPERNAFKPIYQMHKWFARRASCVFRAILLGAMKPAETDIMAEFYKDHTHDPDTNCMKILDPFMGGGTTIVEALRLGCHVTGIDLNPVAWFIVKAEVEPVDIEELKAAFKRLEDRPTSSGKSVKEELLSHYETECPCCGTGKEDADIIYTFWAKSAICTNPNCRKEVPLFANYIIAQKTISVRFLPDYLCSSCKKTFDLDIDRASLIAEESLMASNSKDSAGLERSHKRWAYYDPISQTVACPWCSNSNMLVDISSTKKEKKKVALTVILCPYCGSVWQHRGSLPENVDCPVCLKSYRPQSGNIAEKGKFVCSTCGNKDAIINSIRKLPKDKPLPIRPYAIEGYCSECAGQNSNNRQDLYGRPISRKKAINHLCNIHHNNGKFFKRITPSDLKRYQDAEIRWEEEKNFLSYPKSEIPEGFNTNQMIKHNYHYWHQMFNPRQLLCLSTLLKAIGEEENQVLKEMLLSAYFQALRNNCMFCFYNPDRAELEPLFSRKDYAPPATVCENNVFGKEYGRGSFSSVIEKIVKGKEFCWRPFDRRYIGMNKNKPILKDVYPNEVICTKEEIDEVLCMDSKTISQEKISSNFDLIITDPPYADNVNYSEVADFFYVWLRLILGKKYTAFAPEYTPKAEEIIEHQIRGKSLEDFKNDLSLVFKKSGALMKDNGLLVFTYHHQANEAWSAVLESLFTSGFYVEAAYPYESDARKSGAMGAQKIAYDIIHVCRKRNGNYETKQRSWATVRQEIRQKAREEIKLIESGRYGSERLSMADVNIILIGKCLEIYSKHYGLIVDYKGDVVPLGDALSMIRIMVEQIVSAQQPLPSELEHVDPVTYVYLTCLCDRKEIQSDEVHKVTRGLIEPEVLMKAGVIRKGRAKRGRTYEVKLPGERFKELQKVFENRTKSSGQILLFPELEEARFERVALVDVIHYLMDLAEARENLIQHLREFQSVLPQIRVSLSYLKEKNPTFQEPINKILALIEV
jgi:adenine-specific DNA methylase